MAGDILRNRSLKDTLYESLTHVLSPIQDIRQSGEDEVKALEVTEEFGVLLAEFTVDPQGALAIRQLASVLLKQYVEAHWSIQSDKYRPPETSDTAKAAIRQVLPHGLKESISKVRSSVAYAVSAIAHWDWPEAWPELFQILMEALTSGDANAVHGAMRVLTEFCREITDSQMPQVARVILPEMYKIFTQDKVYSIRTRGRAVDIFTTCAGMISAINDYHKGLAKHVLFPILPKFVEAFVGALQVPDDGVTSDSGLKMEVLKAITSLVKGFPGALGGFLPQILPPVWATLTQSAQVYIKTVINNTEDADDPVDSDGEVLGFENLVYSVFEFIHALIDINKFRGTIRKTMTDLLYYVVLYMQMTEDQARLWSNSPDQFVEDEDDETFSYSVRISAQDLLLSLSSDFPKEAGLNITSVIERHLQDAAQAKVDGNPHWWKIQEATLMALGSIRTLIIDYIQDQKIQFDLNGFLQNVVLTNLNQNVDPFLLGRCLWVASRYTQMMPPELLQQFLEATVAGLDSTQPASVRISAVRAVYCFCEHLKDTSNTQQLQPYLARMMDGMLAITNMYSAEVLALVLETMHTVLQVDAAFTQAYESKVTPLALAVFLKYSGDPLIVSLTQDIFRVLSENEQCLLPVQSRLVPTIVSILQSPPDKIPNGMQAVSLDILQTLVRASSQPLSDALVSSAFPAAVNTALHSDDSATMQSGGECLRAYVSRGLEQLREWQDGQGQNGLYYIIRVISRLLDPKTSEYTATFVGRLVSLLISRVGSELGENLDLMLRAVLSKMQAANTLSVVQSLVLVFAQLIHSQLDAVLGFLCSVPDSMGKPALEFVLTEWCSKQHLFYGAYEGKVSTVALCKLLHHALNSQDPRLQDISVKGERITTPGEGIRTRLKAKNIPEQWTSIPLLVKIYKLLINELSNQIESNMSTQGTLGDENEEETDDWDEDDDDNGGGEHLDDLLTYAEAGNYRGYGDLVDDEEAEDDQDAKADPIYAIDLQTYLTEFLRQLSQSPCYTMFCSHHNDSERRVLQTIGIPNV